MSAPVLLNLLKSGRKAIKCLTSLPTGEKINKMRGLSSILSLLINEFNTFNNTGARISEFYHMTQNNFEITFLP